MRRAVCISCGYEKLDPFDECDHCGFNPHGDRLAMAKSSLLSQYYYFKDDDVRVSDAELEFYSDRLKSGGQIDFDQEKIANLLEQQRILETIPPYAPYLALLRIFAPALVILAIICVLYVVLRSLHH